ncbi:MAG: glycosyltransferase family 4 protein [Acidobacteriota bacterium]|nr:glycosyltransferase family 4 protein [Acidobacteriota bacterium]
MPHIISKIAHRFVRNKPDWYRWQFWHNAQIDKWVASRLPKLGNLVIGYESSSLFTFRRAKELGLPTVLYQPIACAEKALVLLEEERRRFPHLADTLRYNWFPGEELARRREERELADAVICASEFTKRSLVEVGVPEAKIFVEPYGVDQSVFAPSEEKYPRFSVVWASSYTQTKGIGYLLEALARRPVPDAELVLAGYPYGTDAVALYEDRVPVRRIGHVTRAELGQVMGRCHVHVFPTLLEGFGRNIIEAMAAGLPVVTTPNCAGPDLIEDGVTGFIVPVRDVEAICDRLAWVHEHPAEAAEMGARARERVASLTKADYRRRFADRIHSVWQGYGRPRVTGAQPRAVFAD